MEDRLRFIECCNIAIRKGLGDNKVHKEYTWKQLKEKLEHSYKLKQTTIDVIQKSMEKGCREQLKSKDCEGLY